MDDLDAFERRLASELDRMAGPGRRIDAMTMVRIVSAPSSGPRFRALFGGLRFVVAGAIVALFGGVLLSGVLMVKPDREPAPVVGASAPAETPITGSPGAVESDDPVAVEAVDWVTVADASLFEGTKVMDIAVAPGGAAVIVGSDSKTTSNRAGPGALGEGRIWSSADGSEWRRSSLPDARGAQPRGVIATPDGFVAIGSGREGDPEDPDKPGRRVIWTSTDGTDWTSAIIEGAEFTDIDSVGDTVVVAGEQGETQTVWTSTAGGPWQPVTIAPAGSGFTAEQVALSADGVYLVLDGRTGELYRSDDGTGFSPVALPAGVLGGADLAAINAGEVDMEPGIPVGIGLNGDPTGFRLMVDHDGADALTGWASPDGLAWRPEASLPGSLWWLGGDAFYAGGSDLALLQTDGSWCTVPSPAAGQGDTRVLGMAWNDDGDMVAHGWPGRYGDPIIWQATGVRCGR